MAKKLGLYLILLTITMGVSGCAHCSIEVYQRNDGSAQVSYRIAISHIYSKLINDQGANPLEDLKNIAIINGFAVEEFEEQGKVGYTANI